MAVETQYLVAVSFKGVKHLDVQNRVQLDLERYGVERNWLNIYKTDFTDDSMTLSVNDADSAVAIDHAVTAAIVELGGEVLAGS
jgi:hypothetical protein